MKNRLDVGPAPTEVKLIGQAMLVVEVLRLLNVKKYNFINIGLIFQSQCSTFSWSRKFYIVYKQNMDHGKKTRSLMIVFFQRVNTNKMNNELVK